MIVDTSAVLAILFQEPDAAWFAQQLAKPGRKFMSPVNTLEADIVLLARKGAAGQREWELLRMKAGIEIIPFTDAMEKEAVRAWTRYGKGRHKAGLNMGDCCAYALAAASGMPLLCKGNDFIHTDLEILKDER